MHLASIKHWQEFLCGAFEDHQLNFSGTSDEFRMKCRTEFEYVFEQYNQGKDCEKDLDLLNTGLLRTCNDIDGEVLEDEVLLELLANDVAGLLQDAGQRFDAEFTGWPVIRVTRLHVWKSTRIRGFFDVDFIDFGLIVEGFQLLWQRGRWSVGLPGYFHPRGEEWRQVVHISFGPDVPKRKARWLKYLTRAVLAYCEMEC